MKCIICKSVIKRVADPRNASRQVTCLKKSCKAARQVALQKLRRQKNSNPQP